MAEDPTGSSHSVIFDEEGFFKILHGDNKSTEGDLLSVLSNPSYG